MPIFAAGLLNTTALVVPNVYVQIMPPQMLINGVPSNIGGLVGSATWGPINTPMIAGSMQEWAAIFGQPVARANDMSTWAAIAFELRAPAIKGVRVTDGTEATATIVVQTSDITFNSKYPGSGGNGTTVTIATGSAASSYMISVAKAGIQPEIFDNVAAGLSGNAVWLAVAAAINNGVPNARGPSQIITATAGAGTTAPTLATYTLVGGTDGATTITETIMLGTDGTARTGMYALRGHGCSVVALADATTSASWVPLLTLALAEGFYGVSSLPASTSISAAVTAKATAGIDSYGIKLMHGDWTYWNDTYNGLPKRLVSPAAHEFGKLLALAPQHSSLNKPITNVIATERSQTGQPYTDADLSLLKVAGLDVICNPCPGGRYFGARLGCNASSNASIHGDNYTRLTNYIANTLDSAMGIYIGELQSSQPDDPLRRQAQASIDSFLNAMKQARQIDDFKTIIDLTLNPPDRIALGYLVAYVKVRYLAVVEYFIINLEGGQTVTITKSPTAPVTLAA